MIIEHGSASAVQTKIDKIDTRLNEIDATLSEKNDKSKKVNKTELK